MQGKKSFNLERNAKPNHGMTWKLSLLSGNLWGVCIFFFQNHCNYPTVGAGGRGFIQRPQGGAEISLQMPDPGTTLKLHFLSSQWLRPKLRQCYQILFEGDVYLKCILLARNVVFKIGWIDFFILWKKGWDK